MNNNLHSPDGPDSIDHIMDSSIMELIMAQLYDQAPTKLDGIQFMEQELSMNTFVRDGKLIMEIILPIKNKGDNKTPNKSQQNDLSVLCQHSMNNNTDSDLVMSELYNQAPAKFEGIQLGGKDMNVSTFSRGDNLVIEILLPTKGDNNTTENSHLDKPKNGKAKYRMKIAWKDKSLQESYKPYQNFSREILNKEEMVSTHNLDDFTVTIKTESENQDLNINGLESMNCDKNSNNETSNSSDKNSNDLTVHQSKDLDVNSQHTAKKNLVSKDPKLSNCSKLKQAKQQRAVTSPESENSKINTNHSELKNTKQQRARTSEKSRINTNHSELKHTKQQRAKASPVSENLQINKDDLILKHKEQRKSKGTTEQSVNMPYQCKLTFCKCEFSDKNQCDLHMYAHTKLKPVICKICKKEFVNVKSFERHQCQVRHSIDENINTFICDDCGQMYYQKSKYIIHKWSHDQEKPYTCKQCGKKFILKSTLKHHMSSHKNTIFQCFKCKEICDSLLQIKQHMCKKNTQFDKCPHCHKKFVNEIFLKNHIISQCCKIKQANSLKQSKDLSAKVLITEQEKLLADRHAYAELHEKSLDVGNLYSESELEKNSSKVEQSPTKILIDVTGSSPLDSDRTCTNFLSPESSIENRDNQSNSINSDCLESAEESESSQSDINTDTPQIKMLKCVLCRMSFDTVPSFMQHVSTHKDESENTSQRVKSTPKALQVSKSKTIFICRCCEKKFATHKFAKDHLLFYHQGDNSTQDAYHKSFVDSCEEGVDVEQIVNKFIYTVSTGSLSNFTKELTSNSKKPIIYHCSKCNTNFHSKETLFAHIKDCKKNAAKFWCLECNINFDTNKLLQDHLLQGHQKIFMEPVLSVDSKPTFICSDKDLEDKSSSAFTCQRCHMSFGTVKDYTLHRLSKHSPPCPKVAEDTEFVCAHCNLVYSSQALLYKHLQIHKGPQGRNKSTEYKDSMYFEVISKQWVCTICQKHYSSKSNIIRHTSLHDVEKKEDHPCPFCNRVFQYQRYLQHHITYMHQPKEAKYHICDVCKASFTKQQSLKRHMAMHTGEIENQKKFPCDYCAKRFKSKQEVTLHHRSHTGEKPFPCDNCNYSASSYWNLVRHVKSCKSSDKNTDENSDNNGRKRKRKSTDKDSPNTNPKRMQKTLEDNCIDSSESVDKSNREDASNSSLGSDKDTELVNESKNQDKETCNMTTRKTTKEKLKMKILEKDSDKRICSKSPRKGSDKDGHNNNSLSNDENDSKTTSKKNKIE